MRTFEVTSGKINITDPCYGEDTWCAIFNVKAKNGKWEADAEEVNEGIWGFRIARLFARHMEAKDVKFDTKVIGVDSGQAGIFDSSKFEPDVREGCSSLDFDNPISHYEKCCNITLNEEWGVLPHGVVSSSGFGDGGYDAILGFDEEDRVVSVEIIYIIDEEEDEDYGYEDEEEDDY